MKVVFSLLVLSALSFTSCAHKGHHHSHEGRDKASASCCKDKKHKKECKDGACKLKKGEKGKSCCK